MCSHMHKYSVLFLFFGQALGCFKCVRYGIAQAPDQKPDTIRRISFFSFGRHAHWPECEYTGSVCIGKRVRSTGFFYQ